MSGAQAAQPNEQTVTEAGKVLDALATLSVDLSCHCNAPADVLVLPAGKVVEVCSAIDEAVGALKRILSLSVMAGSGPVAPGDLPDLGGVGAD